MCVLEFTFVSADVFLLIFFKNHSTLMSNGFEARAPVYPKVPVGKSMVRFLAGRPEGGGGSTQQQQR
jgi:hypothetical protein